MTAYEDGRAWRLGPHAVYRRFAAAAVAALEHPVAGRTTVDAGAGTGAMGLELAARGARVVYGDRSLGMLRAAPQPAFVCDINALALRDGAVQLAVAGFVLSHVDDPSVALAELARVTRPGGAVLATAFPAGQAHPVKEAVDAVLAESGYRTPEWYERLKRTGEARVGSAHALQALGAQAGLQAVRVRELAAPLTGLDPQAVVAWRLGMAQVAPFLAGLPVSQRDGLVARARAAVDRCWPPPAVRLLALVGLRA